MGNPYNEKNDNLIMLKTNITMAEVPTQFSEPASSNVGSPVNAGEAYKFVFDTQSYVYFLPLEKHHKTIQYPF